MKLSVVVPTYRRTEMLRECLDSIVSQVGAADDIELLVVDNDPDRTGEAVVLGQPHPAVRYVAESARGVVHARNRAVAEAKGAFLAFVDDDEVAAPGWLDAVLAEIDAGADASFGRVAPRYLGTVPAGLERMLDDLYTRDLGRPQGADVSELWAYVGTGNSLFRKAVCFPDPAPFSPRFNASGGEDVWLVRSLLARGIRLRWNPAAVVIEQVPAERAGLDYVCARKFAHGQQRVKFVRGAGGAAGTARMLIWMGVGGLQLAGFGGQLAMRRLTGSPKRLESAVRMQGGLGKLLWWKQPRGHYG